MQRPEARVRSLFARTFSETWQTYFADMCVRIAINFNVGTQDDVCVYRRNAFTLNPFAIVRTKVGK